MATDNYERTPNRYYGRICKHHPELEGLRYKGNRFCVACNKENRRKYIARLKKETGNSKTFHGSVCKKHPELNGLRRICNNTCTECAKERNRREAAAIREELKILREVHRQYD